jgi:hypothetical protein
MAQSFNPHFYRGASSHHLRHALQPQNFLCSDDHIQGIRMTAEENAKFLSPQLLNTDDDVKRDLFKPDHAIHVQHRQ